MPRRVRGLRGGGQGRVITILVVSMLAAGILGYFLYPFLMGLVTPPIMWLRPYKVYLDSFDNTYVLISSGPAAYARSFFCDLSPKRDVYWLGVKPAMIKSDQWVWKEEAFSSPRSWFWMFDYQDNIDCAPNLGFSLIEDNVNEDARTGITYVKYRFFIIIGSDPWLGGAFVGMEAGFAPKNSYVVLRLDPPHPLLSATVNGKKEDYYYNQDGSIALILDIPQAIPQATPLTGPLLDALKRMRILPGVLWVNDLATTFEYVIELQVKHTAVVTAPTATLYRVFGGEGVLTGPPIAIYAGTVTGQTTVSPVLTKMVSVTTTKTVTEFPVVSARLATSTVRGATYTYTTLVPVYTTVYDTRTFTYTGIRTVVTTVTERTPFTETITIYGEVAAADGVTKVLEKIPLWVWIIVAMLAAFVLMMGVMMGVVVQTARSGRPARRYSRGRRTLGEGSGINAYIHG